MRSLSHLWVAAAFACVVGTSGCTSDHHHCRYDPDCGGGIGGFCHDSGDCAEGFCCTTGNCGGGMCTYRCDGDRDCPSDMRCEHDVCFFACDNDRDCAGGMSCEHGNTVCEWP